MEELAFVRCVLLKLSYYPQRSLVLLCPAVGSTSLVRDGALCSVNTVTRGGSGSAPANACRVLQLKHIPPYGFLYHQQLQSLFRQCGQVKSIVFDGAK